MKNLSIIIKEDMKDKIYSYINILEPLLEDRNSQLVIVNNVEEQLDIRYDHIIYEFKEDYNIFKEFCNASCFNNNLLIIESGMVIDENLVKSIKETLLKYIDVNIKIGLNKYFLKDAYYKKEIYIILNLETSNEIKLETRIDDFSYLNNSGVHLKHNIYKFIEDNRIQELYIWYKNCIVNDEKIKLEFYDHIEKYKSGIHNNIQENIAKPFLLENIDSKYCSYLLLSENINKNSLLIDKLNIIIENNFDKNDRYFKYILLKSFKEKNIVKYVFSKIDKECVKAYMNMLFQEYEEFSSDVYKYLVSIKIDKLSEEENKYILDYIDIIEMYFENISLISAEKSKKEMIVQLLEMYFKYSKYILNNNIISDIRRKDFFAKLSEAANFICLNKYKEAINILKEVAEIYNFMTIPIRYFIQKLIYENKIYSKLFSIAMIVKNEEKNLERCLKSVEPLIDSGLAELIIVDTGSEDRTVDIARKYTDRVYFHPWQGSFSEARNWSISLAEGEYIFIMDADYELDNKGLDIIKFFKKNDYKNYCTFSVSIKDYDDSEYRKYTIISQYLIFKNDGNFYYSGNVHNQPNFKQPIKNLDVTIFHYGYVMDSKSVKEGKFKRTANLLKKELQKNPQNIYYRYQLTHSYSMHNNQLEALNQAKLFMKILNKQPLNYEYAMYYITAAIVNFINKKYEETIKICDDLLSLNPEFIDAAYFKAQSLFYKEEYVESIKWYKKYLILLNNINDNPIRLDTSIQLYSIDRENIANSDIETSYLKNRDYNGFLNYVFSIRNKEKIMSSISGVIKSYIELGQIKELILFFNRYILGKTEKDQVSFCYYLKNEIDSMKDEKRNNILEELNKLNRKNIYLDSIKKALINKTGNSLKESIEFLSYNDIENLNIDTMESFFKNIIYSLIENKNEDFSMIEVMEIRKISKYILIQALNKKSLKGLNNDEILKIILKYIDFSILVYENNRESLSDKEILFLKNILLALQHIKNEDLVSAVRAIKNAVVEDEEMANAMVLYIEELLARNENPVRNTEMENASNNLREIVVVETKENVPTLKINNKFLHSRYYPKKDAKTFIDNNESIYKDKPHILVYGIGFAYHIKELLSRLNTDCKVYAFDADEEVFNIANKLGLIEAIKNDSRVELFIGYSKEFMNHFYEKTQLIDDILLYNPSIEALPKIMEGFKDALKNFSISKMGKESFGKLADKNYESNIKEEHDLIEKFYQTNNFKSKPVIIVSSGPSLDYSVKYLKNFKGKAQIFTAGSALKTLMDNGITPDMICIIDANEIIANQIKGYEELNVPLCYLSTASRKAVSSYIGPKFIFYNEPKGNNITIETGNSVATAILDISIKGGANPIIFIGQDLAFVDNKTHSKAYVEVHKRDINIPLDRKYKTVIGVDGMLLKTNTSLLYFKQWIENKISEHSDITFINCSKGAKIKGTTSMELEKVYEDIMRT